MSVVFHCAATLKLEGSLKEALLLNTRGTQRALQLARTLPHLQVGPTRKHAPKCG